MNIPYYAAISHEAKWLSSVKQSQETDLSIKGRDAQLQTRGCLQELSLGSNALSTWYSSHCCCPLCC